jgi:uncharacterized membrane protein YdjX (TVP38/TMEM64 family)
MAPMTPEARAAPEPDQPAALARHHHLRNGVILLAFVALAGLLSIDRVHVWLHAVLTAATPSVAAHPLLGRVVFVLLAAASAVLAFFSSAVLVPGAVYAWGKAATIALLWLGWTFGGAFTYAIGRVMRRPLLRTLGASKRFESYLRRIPSTIRWPLVLLLQLALPSEVPGYLCGFLRVRFAVYLSALALAEMPYAIGTVLVGETVLQRRPGWLLVLGAAGVLLSLGAYRLLHRQLDRRPPPEDSAA